ncbi:hypothetical protein TthSNM76_13660 [Thermus thermophilus]|nr:hypothetical protein TthSNM76_13660 [Thermus thermophilus]
MDTRFGVPKEAVGKTPVRDHYDVSGSELPGFIHKHLRVYVYACGQRHNPAAQEGVGGFPGVPRMGIRVMEGEEERDTLFLSPPG